MKRYGKGIASTIYPIGATASSNPSGIHIGVSKEGVATVNSGTCEIGQGSNTVLSQITADGLGININDVKFISSQTQNSPYDHGAGASRQTYIAGTAIKKACQDIKSILLGHCAEILEKDVTCLEIQNGYVKEIDSGQNLCPLHWITDLIYQNEMTPQPVADAVFDPAVTALESENGQGRPFSMYAFATNIVELEVDDETGIVTLLSVAAVHDIGILVNPMLTEGQVIGGICMSIGYALYEEIIINEKGVLNPSFVDYILPTALDMPKVKVKFIDSNSGGNAKNSKGIGEPSTVSTAPAIANAIYNAVGVRCYELPITPQKILVGLNVIKEMDLDYESRCIK